jgi:hypothetical protein
LLRGTHAPLELPRDCRRFCSLPRERLQHLHIVLRPRTKFHLLCCHQFPPIESVPAITAQWIEPFVNIAAGGTFQRHENWCSFGVLGNTVKLSRHQFLYMAAGLAALPAVSRIAWAQAYPARPVRLIVGFAPGGGTDVVARPMRQWLSERLGQPFLAYPVVTHSH